MDRLALFFSIIALVGGLFIYKLILDQQTIFENQRVDINNLRTQMVSLANQTKASVEVLSTGTSTTPQVPAVKLKMLKGYFCEYNAKENIGVVYFDGESVVKNWGETDGTKAFEKLPPDGVGTYQIKGNLLLVELDDPGMKVSRTATLTGYNSEGVVLEFDYYGTIYNSTMCHFGNDKKPKVNTKVNNIDRAKIDKKPKNKQKPKNEKESKSEEMLKDEEWPENVKRPEDE